MMYSERDKSRDRSRDREKKHHRSSPSEDSEYRHHRHRQTYRFKPKRVKFQDTPDIRVFRKEDEPCAKGLSEEEIQKLKLQIQKEIKTYVFNSNSAHDEASNEKKMRQKQQEKEKVLYERLAGVTEEMGYICPLGLTALSGLIQVGSESEERVGHTTRCYYTSLGQIPDEPQFQLLNNSTNTESKIIKFDNDHQTINNSQLSLKRKQEKPLKGILKTTISPQNIVTAPPRHIDPQLILLLKDLKVNPTAYSKDKTELLLKPYKESGELQYLMKNKQVLEMMLRNLAATNPNRSSTSAGRQSHQRPLQPQPYNNPMGYSHNFVPKADKYRTVPCKYYHSHLGCNKIDNCTYIHDQRYAGMQPPPNYTPPIQQSQPNTMGNPAPTPMQGMYHPPMNTPRMPNTGQTPYGMNTPVPPYSNPNPGYYPPMGSGNRNNNAGNNGSHYPPNPSPNYGNNHRTPYPNNSGSYSGGNNANYQGGGHPGYPTGTSNQNYSGNTNPPSGYSGSPPGSNPNGPQNGFSGNGAYGGNYGGNYGYNNYYPQRKNDPSPPPTN